MINSVAVVGLGKLGLPMAATFAAKGIRVVGVDLDEGRVTAVNEGRCPIVEPGLDEIMQVGGALLTATTDVREAVSAADATVIIVPTPSVADGSFSLDYVLPACEEIGAAIRAMDWHLVVLTSTVSPCATGGPVLDALERASGKTCGREFGLCYSPEFVALGNVIENMLRPDFVLIGESDGRSGDMLSTVYDRVCENEPPVARMSFVNAEITKLSVNTFVTTKISFANMLSEMCEAVPGGNVDSITSALGLDTRIGSRYLKGGLGYGGPCFPRDNRALAQFARSVGVDPYLAEATDATNNRHLERVAEVIRKRLEPGETVAILGLSYKPFTDVVERSQGLELAQALASDHIEVRAFDPVAGGEAAKRLGSNVAVVNTIDDCVAGASVIVFATPWETFAKEAPRVLAQLATRPTVIDCWRMLDPLEIEPHADYVALGVA